MDILDEIAEKFMLTLDSELCGNSNYLKAMALLHEFSEHELSANKATELEDIAARLSSATFNAGIRSGLRLGTRITVGLISSDK